MPTIREVALAAVLAASCGGPPETCGCPKGVGELVEGSYRNVEIEREDGVPVSARMRIDGDRVWVTTVDVDGVERTYEFGFPLGRD